MLPEEILLDASTVIMNGCFINIPLWTVVLCKYFFSGPMRYGCCNPGTVLFKINVILNIVDGTEEAYTVSLITTKSINQVSKIKLRDVIEYKKTRTDW